MFNLFKQEAFGIDLSDFSIKIAQLKKDKNGLFLASYCRQDVPAGIIEQGEIKQIDVMVEIVKQAMSKVRGLPIKTKNCVASLPETEAFIQLIQLPKMREEEIAEAIKWETENHIPLPIDEVYFDWQIIAPAKKPQDHLDILVGALNKNLVDPYLDALKKAGLQPLVFEIESIATARALFKDEFSAEPVMIVDLGAKRSSLIIFSGRAVQFTASSLVCNDSLIRDIAKRLDISQEKARQLKFEIGLDNNQENREVLTALEPGLKELIGEMKKYIEFYYTYQSAQISKILLCGGGANLTGLRSFIAKELKINVEMGNPWINILKSSPDKIPELPYEQSIGYATVLGLALRGLRINNNNDNS